MIFLCYTNQIESFACRYNALAQPVANEIAVSGLTRNISTHCTPETRVGFTRVRQDTHVAGINHGGVTSLQLFSTARVVLAHMLL